MSNQFSYELDERQIRLMMRDAELEYNEAMWQKFDSLSIAQSKSISTIGNYIPAINLSISRSIIVPIIFIVLIGGLSAMLFSFVDFKKKESIEKEIPYVAKIDPAKQAERTAKPIVKSKSVATPILTAATPIKDTTTSTIVTNSTNVVAESSTKKDEQVKVIESKPKQTVIISSSEQKKETVIVPHKKKRKVKTEVLPTINATTPNLNEGVSEPELDLK